MKMGKLNQILSLLVFCCYVISITSYNFSQSLKELVSVLNKGNTQKIRPDIDFSILEFLSNGSLDGYLSLAELNDFIDRITNAFSDILETKVIGKSPKGNPIRVTVFGKKESNVDSIPLNSALLTAMVNGNDPITMHTNLYLLLKLIHDYNSIQGTNSKRIFNTRRLYFIPILDVDTYAEIVECFKNSNNLDMCRNGDESVEFSGRGRGKTRENEEIIKMFIGDRKDIKLCLSYQYLEDHDGSIVVPDTTTVKNKALIKRFIEVLMDDFLSRNSEVTFDKVYSSNSFTHKLVKERSLFYFTQSPSTVEDRTIDQSDIQTYFPKQQYIGHIVRDNVGLTRQLILKLGSQLNLELRQISLDSCDYNSVSGNGKTLSYDKNGEIVATCLILKVECHLVNRGYIPSDNESLDISFQHKDRNGIVKSFNLETMNTKSEISLLSNVNTIKKLSFSQVSLQPGAKSIPIAKLTIQLEDDNLLKSFLGEEFACLTISRGDFQGSFLNEGNEIRLTIQKVQSLIKDYSDQDIDTFKIFRIPSMNTYYLFILLSILLLLAPIVTYLCANVFRFFKKKDSTKQNQPIELQETTVLGD